MAEEQNGVPAGQENQAGTAPAGGEGQTTPAGSTHEQTSAEQDIRDPAAFYQSQAEKWERLFKKAEEERTSLEQRVAALDQSTKDSVNQDFEALKAEIAKEREAAQAELLQAKRLANAVESGLPKAAAKFITGTTDEEIAAQIEELRSLFPAGGTSTSNGGRVGAPASGSELTRDAINKMTPKEIIARRDEVREFLRNQKK